jgi:hypothetical protein
MVEQNMIGLRHIKIKIMTAWLEALKLVKMWDSLFASKINKLA